MRDKYLREVKVTRNQMLGTNLRFADSLHECGAEVRGTCVGR